MKLILVRHGDTVGNSRERYIGRTDSPLDDAGREQAIRLAARLRGEGIERIYSSALIRARDTAETIAGALALEVRILPELNEIDFGEWEGLTIAEIEKLAPERFGDWRRGDETFRYPGGEGRADFRARARRAIRHALDDGAGLTSAIVAHVGIVRTAIGDALGLAGSALWSFRVDPASIHVVHFESDRMIIAALNDTAHLR